MISKRRKRTSTQSESLANHPILIGKLDDKSAESLRNESGRFALNSSSALKGTKRKKARGDCPLAANSKSGFVVAKRNSVRKLENSSSPSRCRHQQAASLLHDDVVAVDELVALQSNASSIATESPSKRQSAFCRTSSRNDKARLRPCLLLASFVVFCSKLSLAAEAGRAESILLYSMNNHSSYTTRSSSSGNNLDSDGLARPKRAMPNLVSEQNSGGDDGTILVQTKHGLFQGALLASDRVDDEEQQSSLGDITNANVGFLGIRYASAPIKRLRFMPPTAYHYTPNQVHSMQTLGPICRQRWPVDTGYLAPQSQQQAQSGMEQPMTGGGQQTTEQSWSNWIDLHLLLMKRMMPRQSFVHLRPLFKRLASLEQSEDCLNLNVYAPLEAIPGRAGQQRQALGAPGAPATLRPVLVIIHGDSFDFGAGSAVDALKFVQLNRMLAVTFNYRLNILGFPPKLAGASRGNLGLMDQVAALHWIKDNIGSFGGAANNITLMGTKRGAIFVNLLMLSPLARGLFQRAIMEDGSALTPLIANQIGSPLASIMLGSSLQSSNSLAVHHLRLLAKLCHCPVYLQPAASLAPNITVASPASSTSSGGAPLTASRTPGAPIAAGAQQQLSGFADETKANALTFECLRQKPIEQIMQRVPLDLLQFNQVSGEITIAQRFLSRGLFVAAAASNIPQHQPSSGANLLDPQRQQQPSTSAPPALDSTGALDSVQLERLVERVTREQLERESANIRKARFKGSEFGYSSAIDTPTSSQPDPAMVSELFGAIYGQPSASVRPLFAPVIDGTIVPDEDIASNMMKAGSLFGQRDLLIGLSQKSISETVQPPLTPQTTQLDSDKNEQQQQQQSASIRTTHSDTPFELGPDHLMAERVTEQMERFGLSSEQAIELVNSFVRSLYRHHNQEISNSIVNNFLGQSADGTQRATARKTFKQQFANNQYHHKNQERLADEIQAKISQQQLLALDSLLEAFHDALTNVPVLKTALIHATRQLDSLVDAFVGQQFEKWKLTHWPMDVNYSSGQSSASIGSNNNSSLMSPDQNQLLDSFVAFARSLFNDSGWPLKLRSPSNASVQQPKGTYLFQFDSGILIREIQSSINRLATRGGSMNSHGWKGLKETLNGLLMRLQSGQQFGVGGGRRLGLGCGLELDTNWPNEYELSATSEGGHKTGSGSRHNLWAKLNDWLCSKLTRTLGNFAASGNVNGNSYSQSMVIANNNNNSNNSKQEPSVSQSVLSERIARFEDKCNSVNELRVSVPADHHSVQAATPPVPATTTDDQSPMSAIISSPEKQMEEITTTKLRAGDFECKRELDSIAFDYLVGGDNYYSPDFSGQPQQQQQQNRWTAFNLFTQQTATLPSSSNQHLWLVNEVIDSGPSLYHDQKSSFSARSSFWSNFIPALNCSKTQPTIPSSFMLRNRPLASVSNSSSLLSLNLLFNCQMGSRSALDAIESLSSNINQQLQARIGDWRLSRANLEQNHHTLRMANMSQSSSIEENIEQQEPIDEQNGNANKGSTIGRGGSASGGAGQQQDGQQQIARTGSHPIDMRSKYIGILVVVCGLVISLSLASGACVVMHQRSQLRQSKQGQRAKRRKSSSSPSIPSNKSNHSPLVQRNSSSQGFSVNGDDADDDGSGEQEQHVPMEPLNASNALSEQQQQTSLGVAGANELALGKLQTQDQRSIERTSREGSVVGLLEQSSASFANSNHVCTVQSVDTSSINRNGSLVYWENQPGNLAGRQDLLLEGSDGRGVQQQMALCRSHSSLDATTNGMRSMMNNQSSIWGRVGVGRSATIGRLPRVQAPSSSDQQLTGSSAVAVYRHYDDAHQLNQQQPIMLPLLNNSVFKFQHQDELQQQALGGANSVGGGTNHHLRHRHGLLPQASNGSHYGGSSSETTQATQSSAGSSSVATIARVCGSTSGRPATAMLANATPGNKKRVQISDPVSATMGHSMKQSAKQQQYININNNLFDYRNDQQALSTRADNCESQLSLEASAPNYCPVHRNQQHREHPIGASLDGSQINYLVNDAFLTTNLWDGAQTIDLLDQRLASVNSNCDQFSSDNTTPLGSYLGGQAQHQAQPQVYHYAPTTHHVDSPAVAFVSSLADITVNAPNLREHYASNLASGLGDQ